MRAPAILRKRASSPEMAMVRSLLAMYDSAIDHFSCNDYTHYEISNFARPGFECLHNMNYWDRGEYIGTGAGAHSFLTGIRSKNTKQVDLYIERLEKGLSPDEESVAVTPSEVIRECIFLGLRKIAGISISDMNSRGVNI